MPSNKRMQLTKLRAAPVLRAEVPPCAPAGKTDGGTASQLIRGVRRTDGRRGRGERGIGPETPAERKSGGNGPILAGLSPNNLRQTGDGKRPEHTDRSRGGVARSERLCVRPRRGASGVALPRPADPVSRPEPRRIGSSNKDSGVA
jgi:hypothetical protein